MAYDLSVLDQGCQEMDIVLNGEQRQQFVDFYEYLVEKNKVMNLTGITEFQEVLIDRKSTRLNSSHIQKSRLPSSA